MTRERVEKIVPTVAASLSSIVYLDIVISEGILRFMEILRKQGRTKPRKGEPMPKGQPEYVKTSLKIPVGLWREAHIRAMDERSDLARVIAAALEMYLSKKGAGR
jgi:hypothetical protein